jgi:hypothetical protein
MEEICSRERDTKCKGTGKKRYGIFANPFTPTFPPQSKGEGLRERERVFFGENH